MSSSEQVRANQLVLRFSLPAGTYAISVLSDILSATEPDRRSESEEPAPAE